MSAEAIVDPVGRTDAAEAIGFRKADHPNASAILFDNLARNPDETAIVSPSGRRSYRELCADAEAWARAFAADGLARGDRVALLLDDRPTYPAAFFGAVRAGFVPVLLNTQSPPELLRYLLEDSAAPVLVADAEFAPAITEEVRAAPALRRIVMVGGATQRDSGADAYLAGRTEPVRCADTRPDDMAFWMYSSGSTGRPKGVVHLQHDMAFTAASYGRHILDLRPGDLCFSVPKMFFAYGFGASATFPFAVGAASFLLPGRPDPARILEAIEQRRPTVFFGLPTLYTALCKDPSAAGRDLSSLRLAISAAEILSQEIFDAWRDLTGLEAIEGLGSTEMLHIYLSNAPGARRIASAGRVVPGYDVELRGLDGRPTPSGEVGEMWVRGDSSAPVYWGRPDKTAETMRGDWLCTHDRFVEDDGFYYFKGRTDDLIKVSGQWVWPMEIEVALHDHPAVYECAVLPQPLDDGRTTLRAVVRLTDGTPTSDDQVKDLQDFIKKKLQPYKYPRIIEFVDALPKTGTGKLDRQALKRPAISL